MLDIQGADFAPPDTCFPHQPEGKVIRLLRGIDDPPHLSNVERWLLVLVRFTQNKTSELPSLANAGAQIYRSARTVLRLQRL